jgi:hypothetical protein
LCLIFRRPEAYRKLTGSLPEAYRKLTGSLPEACRSRVMDCMPKKRTPPKRPPLTVDEILGWADDHNRRTGAWPGIYSGTVRGGPLGENWRRVDNALRYGLRGLKGKSSLAQLLAERRGYRNCMGLPRLSDTLVLSWADAHFDRCGKTWKAVQMAACARPARVAAGLIAGPARGWLTVSVVSVSTGVRLPAHIIGRFVRVKIDNFHESSW